MMMTRIMMTTERLRVQRASPARLRVKHDDDDYDDDDLAGAQAGPLNRPTRTYSFKLQRSRCQSHWHAESESLAGLTGDSVTVTTALAVMPIRSQFDHRRIPVA